MTPFSYGDPALIPSGTRNPFLDFEIPEQGDIQLGSHLKNWPIAFTAFPSCCAAMVVHNFPANYGSPDDLTERRCLNALQVVQNYIKSIGGPKTLFFTLSEHSNKSMIALVESVPGIDLCGRFRGSHGPYFVRAYTIRSYYAD